MRIINLYNVKHCRLVSAAQTFILEGERPFKHLFILFQLCCINYEPNNFHISCAYLILINKRAESNQCFTPWLCPGVLGSRGRGAGGS